MRERLTVLLEKADLALGSASGVIADDTLAPLIDSVRGVRTRLAYPEDVLVVALAGGTGSGKSSLFNAICEEELVDVGGVRPTTSKPAAAVPAGVGSSMDGYLDQLGIVTRHTHDGAKLCLLDLPDTDSVELEHRYRVDALLPVELRHMEWPGAVRVATQRQAGCVLSDTGRHDRPGRVRHLPYGRDERL